MRAILGFCAVVVAVFLVSGSESRASNFKTVCASGCDYTDVQAAIDAAPTYTTRGAGAGSPWVIQVQIGVFPRSTSLVVDQKSYLTIEGIGDGATVIQATAGWFNQLAPGTNEQFLTISNSDNVAIRDLTIDATTNTPEGTEVNQSGGGAAGVFLQKVNPMVIDNVTITGFNWGLRDANPSASEAPNNNNLKLYNSRITSDYVAGWMSGGSVWLVWNSEFRGDAGLVTITHPPTTAVGMYVTGAKPSGARNVFTAWGCHFHAESPYAGVLRGVDITGPNLTDVISFVGSTLHAKSHATESSVTVSPTGLYAQGAQLASVDVSGSEIIYEGLATATTGTYSGVLTGVGKLTVNLTGTSIIDRARDDSTNPPTLAGSTHKDIHRLIGPPQSGQATVHVIGSRAVSMSGNSSTIPQSLDTVEMQAGSIAFNGTTATVTLPAVLPNNKYRVAISVNGNEPVWVSSKTTTNFTLQTSTSSTVTVDWIVRY